MNSLKFYRLKKNLTMDEISHLCGISPAMYSKIEKGEGSASNGVAEKLSSTLGVSVDLIFAPSRFTIRDVEIHLQEEGFTQ